MDEVQFPGPLEQDEGVSARVPSDEPVAVDEILSVTKVRQKGRFFLYKVKPPVGFTSLI